MKKIIIVIGLVLAISSPAFADSAAEELCKAAYVANGKDNVTAGVLCSGTDRSAAYWACVLKYINSGKDMVLAGTLCSDK